MVGQLVVVAGDEEKVVHVCDRQGRRAIGASVQADDRVDLTAAHGVGAAGVDNDIFVLHRRRSAQ